MSSPFVIPSVFTAIDRFSGPVKGMSNALNGFVGRSERLLGRANAAFSRLLTPITSINKLLMGLGFYVGLFTLVRLLKNAIDVFADFEQANADLAVVMGTTVKENRMLASEARRIGLAYGESATDVVRMQHALATLGFEQDQIMKMGRPLITGSAALEGANPERLADTVGAVINTFDNLTASDTQHILDVMALSANRTALNFEKLATTLPIVSGPANAVGISFERVVALLGVLSNAGVHVATSATSLKNIFIDSAKKGHTYEQVLANIAKHSDKLVYANKQFGKRSVVSALALTQKMNEAKNGVIALTEEFKNAKLGLTEAIAIQRLDTFRGAQKLLNAAYHEFILSIEDGNGSLAQSLKHITQVASAMLLLSSDSDQAREAVAKLSPEILETANKWLKWLKIIGWLTAAIIAMKVALLLWRTVVIAATIVQGAWSIAMGIGAANGWLNVFAIRGNVVALTTFRIWAMAATGAQAAFNLVMRANPIFLMAAAILALVESYREMNNELAEAKKRQEELGEKHGIKYESKETSIMDKLKHQFLGTPIETGVLKFSSDPSTQEDYARERNKKINPKADLTSDEIMQHLQQILKGNINLNINDPGKNVDSVKTDSSWIKPKLSQTNGWGYQ
jgi:hypothetical protein